MIRKILALSCLMLVLTAGTACAEPDDLGQRVLAETNAARQNPQRYAQYIREFKKSFIGKGYRLPGSLNVVMTSEGKPALDEAVQFLSRQRPLPALSWSPGLARAAADLVREQGGSGETGHGERSDMKKRIDKYGSWRSSLGENISYGPDTARQVVMGLIIDDGVADRGHRKNIFDRSYTTVGIACGPHPLYRTICVMDLAGGFQSR
ncbi:CAP domain-containing protein [Geomonas paludis]|uniref:CAP domain-containing protein n=1 Tax=Geomonas paludis TaxID=2740185 RepID=A0A6V8N3Z4_9BACT|nr:CAP domain-containing protein [Geomonas paludis]UPU37211.1 CAP domain-containing protein [Geomonas paludis]GFO66353.1 serine protease [Geomonas paludis]